MAIFDELLDGVKRRINDFLGARGKRRGTRDNPLPASEDPYGDPADEVASRTGRTMAGRNVRPASEDPYGDPADEAGAPRSYAGREVRPASEDPWGDPADERRRR